VVLELLRGERTRAEILSQYEIHGSMADKWQRKAVDEMDKIFSEKDKGEQEQKLISELYKQIGQLKVETDWLKKKIGLL
jgi:hypothetical protein